VRRQAVLLRIDAAGTIVWARLLGNDWEATRLVRRRDGADEFVVVGRWGEPDPRAGGVLPVLRINANGAVVNCVGLTMPSPAAVVDVVAAPGGYVLLTRVDPPAPGPVRDRARAGAVATALVISMPSDMNGAVADLLGTTEGFLALDLLVARSDSIVLAGSVAPADRTPRRAVLVATTGSVTTGLTPASAFAYRLSTGTAGVIGMDVLGADVVVVGRPDVRGAAASILRTSATLAPIAEYGLKFGPETGFTDFHSPSTGSVVLAGNELTGALTRPVLLSVGATFECCKTELLPRPEARPLSVTKAPGRVALAPLPARVSAIEVGVGSVRVAASDQCGVKVTWDGERMSQSPHLQLQSAGSEGLHASRGVLLRWFLTGALEDHVPKGVLAGNSQGFNKPDDFVALYRAEWTENVTKRRLSFLSDRPVYVDDGRRTLSFLTGSGPSQTLFAVRLSDAAGYAAAKQAVDPSQDPAGFLAAYGPRPFEVELRGVLAVACDLAFRADPNGSLEVEARSVGSNELLADKQLTARRVLGPTAGPVARLVAENLSSVRAQCTNARLEELAFTCYDDVLTAVNGRDGWTLLGQFGLTTDQATAFRRLEDPARFQVHGVWRKYNDGAFVNVANYKNRWSDPAAGLEQAVRSYITLSDSDPSATANIAGTAEDDGVMQMSYLDLLQIAAFDFHVARMLGLGHVDSGVAPAKAYVHLAVYVSKVDLMDGAGARPVQHLYMSLPTTLAQARLPLVPELGGIEYGLSIPTGSGPPHELTGVSGYTPDGLNRFIRLYPGCGPLYAPDPGFFDTPDVFDLSESSLPVLYGVEYRAQGATAWRRPEIAHDATFVDTSLPPLAEPVSTPFPIAQRDAAFIHRETEEGVHEYGVYSVNIFSVASAVSAPQATDFSVFQRRNTLQPPSDLQVQLVQKESTLVLTTASEQGMLEALESTGGDTTLVRVCFNYGFAQDESYDFADRVEILHRPQVPRNVIGRVRAVSAGSDPGLLRIETDAYTYASTGMAVAPVLPPALVPNFVGGVLVAGATRLVVEGVQWPGTPGPDPVFMVRKPTTTGVLNNAGANVLVTQEPTLSIAPGDLVMAVENMAAAASWGPGNPLATTVSIGDPSWIPRIETFTRDDGTTARRSLRGVWAEANVVWAESNVQPDPLKPNHYEIVFDTYALEPHTQANAPDAVNWWKGIVRVPVDPASGRDPEDRRMLTVLQVLEAQSGTLVLLAADDSNDPHPVHVGPSRLVNYYPGYKVYLHADPPNGFHQAALEPPAGEDTRTTLLALRSTDSTTVDGSNQAYRSSVGIPQLLTSRRIVEPRRPRKPRGLSYAAPPDVYGKSSYTLTVDFDHEPFAAAFYRADAISILAAIYHPDTLSGLRTTLFVSGPDPSLAARFGDLFDFMDDKRDEMAAYPAAVLESFTLPRPDAPGLGSVTAEGKADIKEAALQAFVPLTVQPLVYTFIRTDPGYQPTNRPQTFRDANGDLLRPGAEGFDLAPMAKRPTAADSIQFTDFTLDGSMNPNTVYFYYAREISNAMQIGDASEIFGPVKLVNLTAPAPPTLRRISVAPYDVITDTNPEVRFEVVAPSRLDPMAALRIFRTIDPGEALSVRTMRLVKELDVRTLKTNQEGAVMVADDFSGEDLVPYGDPLFYRLAWVREVHYEDAAQVAKVAHVLSEPTRTLLANVVDVVNPMPPLPTVTATSAGPDNKLVHLTWAPTVHNGTYYVCRLDPSGNWARVGVVQTNTPTATFDLPDPFPIYDEDGGPIYYRFKVDVLGPSGLLNLIDRPVTVRLDSI